MMKYSSISFNKIAVIAVSMLLISCGAPQERAKISNENSLLMNKLTYSSDDIASISDQLEREDPKYADLKKKAKSGKLTLSEEREVQQILDKKISEYHCAMVRRAQINKDNFQVIVFKEDRCHKCDDTIKMVKEAAKELGIKVAVLKPEEFRTYVKVKHIEHEPVAEIWLNLYSNPASLNRVVKNLPVMLYSGKKDGILTVARVESIKSKQQLKDEIVETMDQWDSASVLVSGEKNL